MFKITYPFGWMSVAAGSTSGTMFGSLLWPNVSTMKAEVICCAWKPLPNSLEKSINCTRCLHCTKSVKLGRKLLFSPILYLAMHAVQFHTLSPPPFHSVFWENEGRWKLDLQSFSNEMFVFYTSSAVSAIVLQYLLMQHCY